MDVDTSDTPVTNQQPASFANENLHLTPDSFLNANPTLNGGGTNPNDPPVKRKPGRPKGSGKKHLLGTTGATTASAPRPTKKNDSQGPKRPVGRPRRDGLPAGSVGPPRARKNNNNNGTDASASAHVTGTQVTPNQFVFNAQPAPVSSPIHVLPVSSTPLSISSGPPTFSIPPPPRQNTSEKKSHSFDTDDWAELARTQPHGFLTHLLMALSTVSYPQSSSGLSVKEAFKSHLNSLAPSSSPIPTLYSILKTFWLPTSPAYFSLTASSSTARTPPDHRFLYWDPQPLVFNGIACHTCSTPLINRGRIKSGPLKVYDIERPFFIIGCEYVCLSQMCISQMGPEGRRFASTDPSIWRALPNKLKDEFPARLVPNDQDSGPGSSVWNWQPRGVSKVLWNMVQGCLRVGLKKDVILQLIHDTQIGVPEELEEKRSEASDEVEMEDYLNQSFSMNGIEPFTRNNAIHVPSQTTPAVITDAYGDAWKANTAVVAPVAIGHQESPTAPDAELEYPQADAEMHSPAMSAASPAGVVVPSQNADSSANEPQPYGVYTPATSFHSHSFSTGYPPNAPTQTPNEGAPTLSPVTAAPHVSSTSSTPVLPTASTPTPAPIDQNGLKRPFSDNSDSQVCDNILGDNARKQRSPRHCSKCGSPECKGKGGRAFCTNPCKDCGKLECKGRNSRRPDKPCSEGWD